MEQIYNTAIRQNVYSLSERLLYISYTKVTYSIFYSKWCLLQKSYLVISFSYFPTLELNKLFYTVFKTYM